MLGKLNDFKGERDEFRFDYFWEKEDFKKFDLLFDLGLGSLRWAN